MVPGQAAREDGGLVDELGVELLAAEAGCRLVQGGVGQLDAACLGKDRRLDAGDMLGQPEMLGQPMYRVTGPGDPAAPCLARAAPAPCR